MNIVEAWDQGYGSVHFLASYSFSTIRLASTKHEKSDDLVDLVPWQLSFASGVGACMGRVEPFKHFLHATAHPHFLVFELQATMGTCLEHYGIMLRD